MVQEIGLETARRLIDFAGGVSSGEIAWEKQLEGAVALHNLLVRHKVAYLADEVGMGKTYVALGVVGLFRHFNPGWRVLYIAPRENIQEKWKKELLNFTATNWRITDNKVRSFQGTPAYGTKICQSLIHLAHQVVVNPNRDFFLRMTSFSLGLPDDKTLWVRRRDELLAELPWLPHSLFDMRGSGGDKALFKDNYAKAINTILPHFDLVVIDEAHNLKHGLQTGGAARNRLLSFVLGHPEDADPRDFPNYGLRFDRVLLLSATPLESDYREIWNQLNIFGFGDKWKSLVDADDRDQKEAAVSEILVRRLTGLRIGGELFTKNMYRREWRNGGTQEHDRPLEVADERQRMIVALMQKKVAEVVSSARFDNRFQMGMLSSFESFMETAKVRSGKGEQESAFYLEDQTEAQDEKDGIDTPSINRIARSYQKEFGQLLPHPKMDSVVKALSPSFSTGEKALIFVRRVRSVDELAGKLNEEYDKWIERYILSRLPEDCIPEFTRIFEIFLQQREQMKVRQSVSEADIIEPGEDTTVPFHPVEEDDGDNANFFAWFFRGEGPKNIFSGAAFNRNRLASEGSKYATFFEDNYIGYLLGTGKPSVEELASTLELSIDDTLTNLREVAYSIFRGSSRQKKYPRLRVYLAYQEAALHHLADHARDVALANRAQIVLTERFGYRVYKKLPPPDEFPDPSDILNDKTFFTELSGYPELRESLWPSETGGQFAEEFRQRERRREMLVAAARLGRPFIDLWLLAVKRLGTLSVKRKDQADGSSAELIKDFIELLDAQRLSPSGEDSAFKQLSELAKNFALIIAVNFPTVREASLPTLSRLFGRAFSRQSPIGGMAGEVNKSLVRQFLMPGYPYLLVTTDVLKEGADLHTFCSRVIHYGISWTPSSMEQRTGRIDRIHSLTQRRLDNRREAKPEEFLQVFYPHLSDTVERLQVERLFNRMNSFIRMMHRSLSGGKLSDGTIDVRKALVNRTRDILPITEPLKTAFDVRQEWLRLDLGVAQTDGEGAAGHALEHFQRMKVLFEKRYRVDVVRSTDAWAYFATVYIQEGEQLKRKEDNSSDLRRQPIAMFLRAASGDGKVLLRCVSPIGLVEQSDTESILRIGTAQRETGFGKVCSVADERLCTYDLTVEADILFDPKTTQEVEVVDLVAHTAIRADALELVLRGSDLPMDEFRSDLMKEPTRG